MEPADIMKITMSVEDAQKILPDGTPEGIVPTCISTHIRGKKLTPAQAQAALVLAWNELLSKARFTFQDLDPGSD